MEIVIVASVPGAGNTALMAFVSSLHAGTLNVDSVNAGRIAENAMISRIRNASMVSAHVPQVATQALAEPMDAEAFVLNVRMDKRAWKANVPRPGLGQHA